LFAFTNGFKSAFEKPETSVDDENEDADEEDEEDEDDTKLVFICP
jgi:hypothetical protein